MCLSGSAFGRARTWSLHIPIGLFEGKGKVVRGFRRGSAGFPAQLAPTWKRYGRGEAAVDNLA